MHIAIWAKDQIYITILWKAIHLNLTQFSVRLNSHADFFGSVAIRHRIQGHSWKIVNDVLTTVGLYMHFKQNGVAGGWLYGGRVKMWMSSQASASVEHEVRINGRLISVIGAERNRLCISWSIATVCVLTYFSQLTRLLLYCRIVLHCPYRAPRPLRQTQPPWVRTSGHGRLCNTTPCYAQPQSWNPTVCCTCL